MELKRLFLVFVLFVALYVPILLGWLKVDRVYESFVTDSVMHVIGNEFDLSIKERHVRKEKGSDSYTYALLSNPFTYKNQTGQLLSDFTISPATITANIPMSLAASLAILVLFKRKKADFWLFGQVIVLLFLLHLGSIYSVAKTTMYGVYTHIEMMGIYWSGHSFWLSDYAFISDFLSKYASRFEPFLMMIYIFVRLRIRSIASP
jgi:hypothetical protein